MRVVPVPAAAALAAALTIGLGATQAPAVQFVPYAGEAGSVLGLDLHMPPGVSNPPLVVWVHGGAWRQGSRASVRREFSERGRYRAASGDHGPVIVLSTAHPAKFPDLIEDVLGRRPGMPEQLAALRDQETQVSPLEPTPEALRKHLL
jgi:acetyl esterase/lipase